jgi:hypothetical protein
MVVRVAPSRSRAFVPLRGVSPRTAALCGLTSLGGLAFAQLQGWPLWAAGLAAVLPWLPLFAADVARTYRRYQLLALFYALVVTQTGHLLEHVAQMVQLHALGLTGAAARGVFGALDLEWVHFVWNTWVIAAVAVLLLRFGANRWLWLAALLAGWHEAEHVYILSVYLATGVAGAPGLLAHGGALGGGLPLSRPDLHFLYNLAETLPLLLGFALQVRWTARPGRVGRSAR